MQATKTGRKLCDGIVQRIASNGSQSNAQLAAGGAKGIVEFAVAFAFQLHGYR